MNLHRLLVAVILITPACPATGARADMLYVDETNASNQTGSVMLYDTTSTTPTPTTFATFGVNSPGGLAIDSSGNLYVAVSNNTIEVYTPSGAGSLFASTGLNMPLGMAFDPSGNLYVANSGNNTIEMFTPAGLGSIFATNIATVDLAFDAAGNLYAEGNTLSGAVIERITPGGVTSVFAALGLNAEPTGMAFDTSGNLYVANSGFETIDKITPGGAVSVFASMGLASPIGLGFDASGNLYASNFDLFSGTSARTIEKFSPSGVGTVFARPTLPPGFLAIEPSAVPEPPSLVLGCAALVSLCLLASVRGRQRAHL
jgi:sugar lactone lactonase YvrE